MSSKREQSLPISNYGSLEYIVTGGFILTESNMRNMLKDMNHRQLHRETPDKVCVKFPINFSSLGDAEHKIDMQSLGNVYTYVLTKGNSFNNSENLTEKDMFFSNPYEALDILKLMRSDVIPTLKELVTHPFYWDELQKILFICQVCEFINKQADGREIKKILEEFNMLTADHVIPQGGWIEKLKSDRGEISEHIEEKIPGDAIYKKCFENGKKKLDETSVFDLILFIRDQYMQYYNLSFAEKQVFGTNLASFLSFFTSKFPKLYMHVYANMKHVLLRAEQSTTYESEPDDTMKQSLEDITFTRNLCKPNCTCGFAKKEHKDKLEEFINEEPKIRDAKLDLKRNDTIEEDQYEEIGRILSFHGFSIRLPKAITYEDLRYFLKGFKNDKLNLLDMTCCESLTTRQCRILAKFHAQIGIRALRLSNCHLKQQHVVAFHEQLLEESPSEQLEELDISYNKTLEAGAYKTIGRIVARCGVKTLKLSGCNLDEMHLEKLEINDLKEVSTISMDDNRLVGGAIKKVAEIVRTCELKELDISDCTITEDQLKSFRKTLNEATIGRLNLSDFDRTPDGAYIKEVCKLLPSITNTLCLRFKSLDVSLRRLLQNSLEKLPKRETKIVLPMETVTWQKQRNTAKEFMP